MAIIKLNTRSLSDDSVTTPKIDDTVNLGRRNILINGAMQIWQRGTSLGTNFGYLNDRFKGSATDSGVSNYTMVATRTQDSPIGFKGYCSELSLGTGATGINYATYGQRIEASSFHGVNSGDQMTFSFYVKRLQSADSNFTIYVKSAQSGVDSYQASALISQYEDSVASSSLGTFNSLSTSWERKTFTFTVTDDLITNGGQIFLEMGPANLNVSNTDGLYRTTGWQLEVGDTATPFEHRSYGEELALCQRYFYRAADGTGNSLGLGVNYTSSVMHGAVYFPVTMRAIPTLDAASGASYYEFIRNGAADFFNSLSLGNRTTTRIGEITNSSEISGTVGHGGWIRTDNVAVYVDFDAEL